MTNIPELIAAIREAEAKAKDNLLEWNRYQRLITDNVLALCEAVESSKKLYELALKNQMDWMKKWEAERLAKEAALKERDEWRDGSILISGRTANEARELLGPVSRHSDGDNGASHGCVKVTQARSVIETLIASRDAALKKRDALLRDKEILASELARWIADSALASLDQIVSSPPPPASHVNVDEPQP